MELLNARMSEPIRTEAGSSKKKKMFVNKENSPVTGSSIGYFSSLTYKT